MSKVKSGCRARLSWKVGRLRKQPNTIDHAAADQAAVGIVAETDRAVVRMIAVVGEDPRAKQLVILRRHQVFTLLACFLAG
jgi:hypothetical protein